MPSRAPLLIALSALAFGAFGALGACGDPAPKPRPGGSAAAPSELAPVVTPTAVAPSQSAPLAKAAPDNPFGLPSRKATLDTAKRVFTFSDQMLLGAKLGSTLVLYAATALSLEGDDINVEGKAGPYKVNGAYVIAVPDDPKLKQGDSVLVEHNGVMRHGVVVKFVADKVAIRLLDLDDRAPEVQVYYGAKGPNAAKSARIVRQEEGLRPGNYAAYTAPSGEDKRMERVLLVSPSSDTPSPARRWFALGFAGAAMIVKEEELTPIPLRYKAKRGEIVYAHWAGTMRRGEVQAVDEPGIYTVKLERAGRPAKVGWGSILKMQNQ